MQKWQRGPAGSDYQLGRPQPFLCCRFLGARSFRARELRRHRAAPPTFPSGPIVSESRARPALPRTQRRGCGVRAWEAWGIMGSAEAHLLEEACPGKFPRHGNESHVQAELRREARVGGWEGWGAGLPEVEKYTCFKHYRALLLLRRRKRCKIPSKEGATTS